MKIVIAGNFRQYEDARRAAGATIRDWVYTGIPGAVRGRIFTQDDIVCVGDWWNRPDLSRIMDEIGPILAVHDPTPGQEKK